VDGKKKDDVRMRVGYYQMDKKHHVRYVFIPKAMLRNPQVTDLFSTPLHVNRHLHPCALIINHSYTYIYQPIPHLCINRSVDSTSSLILTKHSLPCKSPSPI
jgi:hypothetical protein